MLTSFQMLVNRVIALCEYAAFQKSAFLRLHYVLALQVSSFQTNRSFGFWRIAGLIYSAALKVVSLLKSHFELIHPLQRASTFFLAIFEHYSLYRHRESRFVHTFSFDYFCPPISKSHKSAASAHPDLSTP